MPTLFSIISSSRYRLNCIIPSLYSWNCPLMSFVSYGIYSLENVEMHLEHNQNCTIVSACSQFDNVYVSDTRIYYGYALL